MNTYMPSGKNIERKWYVVDAAGIPLGRVASQVAAVLRGKNKPEFTPFLDMGDYVIVINADKIVLTGKKLEKKMYVMYSGQPGGLRQTSYKDLMEKRPEMALRLAVKGMLPKNSLGRDMLRKLKIYQGSEYPQQAQKPEKLEIKG